MEFTELIEKRRSCRRYTDEPVTKEQVEELLRQANLSASACNSQPWFYSVLLSPEKKALGAEAVQIFAGTNTFAGDASALVVLSADNDPAVMPGVREKYGSSKFAEIDTGSAAAYFTLAAANAGLYTCIMGVFDEDKLRAAAELPDNVTPKLVIALGHAADADRPHVKKRDPIALRSRIL